jgi:hypothetical protein
MLRVVSGLAIALVLLAGCDQQNKSRVQITGSRVATADIRSESPLALSPPPPPGQEQNAPKLAYSHRLALEMAADKIGPRFERARAACLSDPTSGCILVHASIVAGDERGGAQPSAELTVRLPHDKIAAYQTALLSPLEGEAKGEPIIRQSSTDAEDLTFAIQDADRRMAQLVDYRDRLTALAKRGDAKTQDLIQIEEKISEVQSEIEQLQAQQRGLNLRVATELLSIDMSPIAGLANVRSPLAEAWRNAGTILGDSAARAFTFLVSALPWLPLVALGLWLLVRLWRMVRGRRWRKHPETAGGGAH